VIADGAARTRAKLGTDQSISLVIPCYNEEPNVKRVLANVSAALLGLDRSFEIIVVNDGSSDATGRLADEIAKSTPNVSVIHHFVNRGYGAALRSGLAAAQADIVGYIDGDGQFDAAEIRRLIAYIDRYDIVSGLRRRRRDPIGRRMIGWIWSWLMRRTLGISVRDVNSGFKLYRGRVFDGVELHSDGAFIDAEIFARARERGLTVKEVEVEHYPRTAGGATGANPLVVLRAFRELIGLRSSVRGRPGA
jgi:glycosyltransferase involved in cell wall biosynthesis